jgi:hypothetical protein
MTSQLPFDISRSVEILRQTPATLRAMLTNLSPEWSGSSGDKNNWGPYDVVGHMIHCEETDWMPRAEIILRHGEDRAFTPFDRLAQFERSAGKSLEDLLDRFSVLRARNIRTLLSWNLGPEQLALRGIHPEFGEVTLQELLATWVVHDLNHLPQIARCMARKYSDSVGPWKAYLSILN